MLPEFFDLIQVVDVFHSPDPSILEALKRPELGITLTKLHCWKLTQYTKCVFMDADTLVVKNIDELFDRAMSDSVASWRLEESGEWVRHARSEGGRPLSDLHNVMMRHISTRRRGERT